MNEDDVFNALKYRTYNAKLQMYIWYNDLGQLHRIDGPAIEDNKGHKRWFQNDKLHRVDGPAIDHRGYKEWWINGQPLTEDEFNQIVQK